ncbi:MAG: hypothetical protein COA80_11290 [Leeuwenhoekiella sp.]|nr:MAG: hypothetical protein COA80_11290 [Leeuwenhoekiella sp.]
MKTLALSMVAALGLAAAPAMAQEGAAGTNASESGLGSLSTEAWVFAGVAAAATVAVVSDSSSNPAIDGGCTGPECDPEGPQTTVTVTGTGTNTSTITVPVQ